MTMRKLLLTPESSDYATQTPQGEVKFIELDGGAPFSAVDVLGGWSMVNASFSGDAQKNAYFWAFYNSAVSRGADPFLIDMILEHGEMREYTTMFVPNSTSQTTDGFLFKVSVQLRVQPIARDDDFDTSYLDIYEAWGDDTLALIALLKLAVESGPTV